MAKHRRAARVDEVQAHIVAQLRTLPNISIALNHDDILIGYRGLTFWFEIKDPSTISPKTGRVRSSEIKKSQRKLLLNWFGHYKIVTSLQEILEDINYLGKSSDEPPF